MYLLENRAPHASTCTPGRHLKPTVLNVMKTRLPWSYRTSSDAAYRLLMSDASPPAETWAEYLRRMTKREGWSVARLARESGIHRGTIFKWLGGETGVTVDSVRRIAIALGDEPSAALRAAGSAGVPASAERDEEMDLINRAPVDDDLKAQMRQQLLVRRERERQARLADIQGMIELAKRGVG
jgi:transcriptional regulator with XRE-family HTH domain